MTLPEELIRRASSVAPGILQLAWDSTHSVEGALEWLGLGTERNML